VLTDDAAGTLKLYCNGAVFSTQSVGTSNGVSYSASNVLYLGDPGVISGSDPAPSSPGNYWFGGALSNVAIYSRALPASEILNHYNGCPAMRTPRRQAYVVT
jgi:hypothetical protein